MARELAIVIKPKPRTDLTNLQKGTSVMPSCLAPKIRKMRCGVGMWERAGVRASSGSGNLHCAAKVSCGIAAPGGCPHRPRSSDHPDTGSSGPTTKTGTLAEVEASQLPQQAPAGQVFDPNCGSFFSFLFVHCHSFRPPVSCDSPRKV
jgi:hypothetical protein